MIVLCPSCSTRYRHQPLVPPAVADLECSRCDERFPLPQARRSYVILPQRGANGRASAAAAESRPMAPRIAIAKPAAAPSLAPAPAPAPRAPVAARVAPLELLTEPVAATAAVTDSPEAAPARPRSALAEFVVAIVPPAVGASAGYYFASQAQVDPVAWSALGGAAGFLLGWGCLLWIRRKD